MEQQATSEQRPTIREQVISRFTCAVFVCGPLLLLLLLFLRLQSFFPSEWTKPVPHGFTGHIEGPAILAVLLPTILLSIYAGMAAWLVVMRRFLPVKVLRDFLRPSRYDFFFCNSISKLLTKTFLSEPS